MIVPLGNGGDTRLSVPVPARAVTPSRPACLPACVDRLAATLLPHGAWRAALPRNYCASQQRASRSSARARGSRKGQVAPAAALSSRLTRPFAPGLVSRRFELFLPFVPSDVPSNARVLSLVFSNVRFPRAGLVQSCGFTAVPASLVNFFSRDKRSQTRRRNFGGMQAVRRVSLFSFGSKHSSSFRLSPTWSDPAKHLTLWAINVMEFIWRIMRHHRRRRDRSSTMPAS